MKLTAYLKKTGETDKSFAKRAGLSIFAIRKYRSGARIPRPKNMMRIKKITKESVCESDWYSA